MRPNKFKCSPVIDDLFSLTMATSYFMCLHIYFDYGLIIYVHKWIAPILDGEQSIEKEKVKARIEELKKRVTDIPLNGTDAKQTDETQEWV